MQLEISSFLKRVFYKQTLTLFFLVLFGRPFFLFPLLKIESCSHRIIFFCSQHKHLSAFVFAAISIDTVKSSIVIKSLVFFFVHYISFTPHMAFNIALPALLKIVTSLSFRYHINLPNSMADSTQL